MRREIGLVQEAVCLQRALGRSGDGREPRERPRAPSLEPGPAWMSSASPPRAAPAPARAPRKPRADAGGWEGGHVSDWEAGQSDEWWD